MLGYALFYAAGHPLNVDGARGAKAYDHEPGKLLRYELYVSNGGTADVTDIALVRLEGSPVLQLERALDRVSSKPRSSASRSSSSCARAGSAPSRAPRWTPSGSSTRCGACATSSACRSRAMRPLCAAIGRAVASLPRLMTTQPLSDNEYLFTSESVTEGHPDKVADQISDGVLDAVMARGPGRTRGLRDAGEHRAGGGVGRDLDRDLRGHPAGGARRRSARSATWTPTSASRPTRRRCRTRSTSSRPTSRRAWTRPTRPAPTPSDDDALDIAGAGDQGMMFGYASNETPELMPLPISLAHSWPSGWPTCARPRWCPTCAPTARRRSRCATATAGRWRSRSVLISTQHKDGVDSETLITADLWEHVVQPILPTDLYDAAKLDDRNFLVNPTGRFVIGGPVGDCRPDRAQDHRRHLRRHGPPRRRRVLGQGPLEGRPLGRLRGALRGQERGRRRAGRPVRGAGGLRDRRGAPGVGDGRDVRHREGRPRGDRAAGRRALRPAPGRVPRGAASCTGRSTRRPPPTATSAARTTTSPGRRPTRPRRCARPPASGAAPSRAPALGARASRRRRLASSSAPSCASARRRRGRPRRRRRSSPS